MTDDPMRRAAADVVAAVTNDIDAATDAEMAALAAATPAPDRDELGMTAEQRARWRAHYHAIATLLEVAIAEAPTPTEARRRLALIRLDLRTTEAAVDMVAGTWAPDET